MCGICAIVGMQHSPLAVLEVLVEQQDRGSDATGISWISNDKVVSLKKAINPSLYKTSFEERLKKVISTIAIGHNRAATTNVSNKNIDTECHPFISEDRSFTLLQNGGVPNYEMLQKYLSIVGHKFKSGIDSECLLHMLEEILKTSKTRKEAINKFLEVVCGNVIVMFSDGEVYGFPSTHSFYLVRTKNMWAIASDMDALKESLPKIEQKIIEMVTPTEKSDYIRIHKVESKIVCDKIGEWKTTKYIEGEWEFNRMVMCDFCRKSNVACELVKIDNREYDRCLECHKAKIIKPKSAMMWNYERNGGYGKYLDDDGYNFPNRGAQRALAQFQKNKTGEIVEPLLHKGVGLCTRCHLPIEQDDLIFCMGCLKFYCQHDFASHHCNDKEEELDICSMLMHIDEMKDEGVTED